MQDEILHILDEHERNMGPGMCLGCLIGGVLNVAIVVAVVLAYHLRW